MVIPHLKTALERERTHDVQHTPPGNQTSIGALEDSIIRLLSAAAQRCGNKRCQRIHAEMAKRRPYTRVAQQAKLVSQLDAARMMWQSALHSCRMDVEHNITLVSERLQLMQTWERERCMVRRLDVTMHKNDVLRAQVADLREKVLRDRDQCTKLLQRHSVLTDTANQCARSLQLENKIRSQCKCVQHKLAGATTNHQRKLKRMNDACGDLSKFPELTVLQDVGAIEYGMQVHNTALVDALRRLATQVPSGKIVELLRIIVEAQRSSLELFDRVHRIDLSLQIAIT